MPNALIACEVFRTEIEALLPSTSGISRVVWIEMALHEKPPVLAARLARTIDELEADALVERILLAYGLCGQGTVGLGPRRATLVVPRAHDCVSVFLGSRKRHEGLLASCPHTYFFLPGWNQGGRAPTPAEFARRKAAFAEKFDDEEAEFLIETELASMKHHKLGLHVDTGVGDQGLAVTREACDFLGYEMKVEKGTTDYLAALLSGPWDDARFLSVPPGKKITHKPTGSFLEAG